MRVTSHSKLAVGRRTPAGRFERHNVTVVDDQDREHHIEFEGNFTRRQARERLDAEIAKLKERLR